jgi:hypothetical protein
MNIDGQLLNLLDRPFYMISEAEVFARVYNMVKRVFGDNEDDQVNLNRIRNK